MVLCSVVSVDCSVVSVDSRTYRLQYAVCPAVTHCRPLNMVKNGSYVLNDTTVGSLAHFSCNNECYELVGSGTIECQQDGTWNATEPLCSRKCIGRCIA